MAETNDNWTAGDAYERYMGRWSRLLARSFVTWLGAPPRARWLEVGCGTGALTSAICDLAAPTSVLACDPSEPFVRLASAKLRDRRVSFVVADAEHLPELEGPADFVVSGLVLNFVADPSRAVAAIRERAQRNATVAAYVWDYREGMQFLRHFWDEAVSLDPAAGVLDEGRRFHLCQPGALNALLAEGSLRDVTESVLEVTTSFADFNDFWTPFLTGTGPAPSYVATLSERRRDRLRQRLSRRLKAEPDGSILLKARALTVRGAV